MAAKRPRSVLMTADTVGGVWHYAVELATALGKRGVRVALATMGETLSPAQRAAIDAVPTISVHPSTFKLEWMRDPWRDVARAGAWLLDLERELKPDVVHLNQFAFGALPFTAPTLLVAHSCVLSWWRAVHRTSAPAEWERYRLAVRTGLANATLVAAPTRAMLRSLAGNYGYYYPGVVIPNGRSAERYLPGTKAPHILTAGRLWDEGKNLAALEAVAPELAWPVRVAGPTAGPDGGERATRGVSALGELAPDALAREYACASIYALPARYEPFGLSVLEAALAGCALVLGDIPSLRETWGATALYVGPDDHAGLRRCLSRLIEDGTLRQRLASSARRRALKLTPERTARGYLAAYGAIMEKRPVRIRVAAEQATEALACAS